MAASSGQGPAPLAERPCGNGTSWPQGWTAPLMKAWATPGPVRSTPAQHRRVSTLRSHALPFLAAHLKVSPVGLLCRPFPALHQPPSEESGLTPFLRPGIATVPGEGRASHQSQGQSGAAEAQDRVHLGHEGKAAAWLKIDS